MKFALPKNRFFKGSFMGQAKGRMQDGGEKVAKNIIRIPFTELTDPPVRARGSGIFRLFGGGFPSLYIAVRGTNRKTRKR